MLRGRGRSEAPRPRGSRGPGGSSAGPAGQPQGHRGGWKELGGLVHGSWAALSPSAVEAASMSLASGSIWKPRGLSK